jgi:hypothetical protein
LAWEKQKRSRKDAKTRRKSVKSAKVKAVGIMEAGLVKPGFFVSDLLFAFLRVFASLREAAFACWGITC